ncbi:chondroitin sulfate proteoglycan 4-like [Saccopteryx leptura]|uniref:chondroitin sulfate proteoglycan 4-like n=1 Tax=Saccopteryx leptura TaxID=249018 RepID=UPI00339BBA8A
MLGRDGKTPDVLRASLAGSPKDLQGAPERRDLLQRMTSPGRAGTPSSVPSLPNRALGPRVVFPGKGRVCPPIPEWGQALTGRNSCGWVPGGPEGARVLGRGGGMGRLGARGLALLAACLGLCGARGALGASFYGKSYVEFRIQEASSELSLRLKFQTSKQQGLLFLAAGIYDYCIIELLLGSLQVRANLGAGEQTLFSEQRLRVDDLAWHLLELSWVKGNISLVIDERYETTGWIPGGTHSLRFQHGIYLGGHGRLNVPYLDRELLNFRGCMEDVALNKRELLESLRSYPRFKKVYEVSLGCSDEFFAGNGEAINFFSSRSYVAFPPWTVHGGALLELALQTATRQALLLFQSGGEEGFVALEIVHGLLQARVGWRAGDAQLSSLRSVSDNQWHVIQLRFSGPYVDLVVDGQGVGTSLPLPHTPFVPKGPLYVGGINDRQRGAVRRVELASMPMKSVWGVLFKGCIRGLEANSEKGALKDALVSKDVSAGCNMKSRDAENPTVIATENLLPPETSLPTAEPEVGQPSLQDAVHPFLVLNDLEVQEGGQASLEQKHVRVNMKFEDLVIRPSQILLKIKNLPAHGFLRLDVAPVQELEKAFTMLDLGQGRVWYVHNGSEEPTDSFTISVSFHSRKEMPLDLQGHDPYVLNIHVIPVNDPPLLQLPAGDMLPLFENCRKWLTPNVIHVSDPDTDPLSLSVSVLGNVSPDAGFLESIKAPGRALGSFTHEDLREGHVFYVHRGHRNSRILLRASDGELVSHTVVLRVMAVPWDFEVATRTGVVVPQGGTVLITQRNLSVVVNGELQDMETRYVITHRPQFGQIQRLGSSGAWKQVGTFSQRSIDQARVRYCSTFRELQREDVSDHFNFQVTVEGRVSDELTFPMTVRWLKLTLLRNVPLESDTPNRQVLSSDHLQAVAEGVDVARGELHFKVLTPPKKGALLLGKEVLKANSLFSQQNITASEISYTPRDRPRVDALDSFKFSVVAKHIESNNHTFTINLRAGRTRIILTNRGLSIREGEGKLITTSELFAQTRDNQTFRYEVTRSPQHGKLKRIDFSDSLGSRDSITTFTGEDIMGKRLMYIHDDSETQGDEFLLVASAAGPGHKVVVSGLDTEPLSTEIRVAITVGLKNDERPVRVVDDIFHVVRDGQRLLTLADLCYHDPDSDFDDGQLLYTRRGNPNGDLVQASDPTQRLYQFRQEDLREGRVLFRHRGADSARFVLFVTDGVHFVSSLLEVRASDPYVRIAKNTGLLVRRGEDSALTPANLSVATNQDVRTDREVQFHVAWSPKHSRVLVSNSVSHSFTQHDLKQGRVVYTHDGVGSVDVFNLTVKVKDTYLEVGVCVRVSPEGHPQLHSKTLIVEEGKLVKLSRARLQAVHRDNIPSGATFIVRTPPMHGYLRKSFPEESSLGAGETSPLVFTQRDIDDGNIHYVQTAPGKQQDRFLLDVMSGFHAVSGVDILVDIVPKWIPLEVQNLSIQEGGSKALKEDNLRIPSKYFEGFDCEFVLHKPPRHGYVENSHFPRVKLMKFTRKQVENELIYYVHDDSEELLDKFTIFASSSELGKQSLPQTLFVTVESVNDEAPVITANNPLQVWVNSVTEVTHADLCAKDADSSPQDLAYWVTPPSNGHLALKSLPGQSVCNFMQAHINNGQLVFVHTGAMSGGFDFQVTNGLNFAPWQTFSITARALVIRLEVNRGLSLFPGSTKALTSGDLRAVTNDVDSAGNRTVTFMVMSAPRLGRLVRVNADNSSEGVSVFTQHLVSEQLILYQHVDRENTGWTAEDSFTFTASSPPAALGPQEFHVTISYDVHEPGQASRLLANTGAAVKEGDQVLIDRSMLDASNLLLKLSQSQRSSHEIWFQVTSLPYHGTIMVGESNVTKGNPNFPQDMINKFKVTYLHDDSDSLADHFTFAVWPNPKSEPATEPEADSLEEVFHITISPVNDQPPALKTKGLRLKVLQGDRLVVGPASLKVEDQDSPPEEIRYTLLRTPTNGFLSLAHSPEIPVHHFTQADIDNAQLCFTHDGSPSPGAFYFSVTDGRHRPLYKLFHLEVIPVTITLVNLTDLLLPQGRTTVPVTSAHLFAVTNGRSPQITYEMTQPPRHGRLIMENQVVFRFGQEDLDAGRLSYHMTNMSASEDQLQFSLFTSESNLTGQVLGIRVQPLLRARSHLTVANGVAYRLTREDLDASELANRTNNDPTFEVTGPPVHGRLVRRASHGPVTEDATVFTQRDIDQGLVLLQPRANVTGTSRLNDSFTFLLRADCVQPAVGALLFTIVPPDALLWQTLPPDVSSFVTAGDLVPPAPSQRKAVGSLGPTSQTEALWTLTPTRQQEAGVWGGHGSEGPPMDGKTSPTRVLWPPAATKASWGAPTQPGESRYPLVVIVPLAATIFLLIVTVVAMCVWLRGQKVEKIKSLIEPQTSREPTTTSPLPERSRTVPTVIVTPLVHSPSSAPVSPFWAPPCAPVASPVTEPPDKCAPWGAWVNLHPDMVQLCRCTNPTLKHNQYWV